MKITAFIAATLLLLGCSTEESLETRTKGSACKQGTPALALSGEALALCTAEENIGCDLRVYGPKAGKGQAMHRQCTTLSRGNTSQTCVNLVKWQFNTSALQGSEDPQHFQPGGSLNYQEYVCYNRKLQKDHKTLIQSRGASFDKAIAELVALCAQVGS